MSSASSTSTTTTSPSPTQQLQQTICQKFGWSCIYQRNESTGTWTVTVSPGMYQKRTFTTQDTYVDDKTGEKAGKADVSTMALEALQESIARMESVPIQELTQVFASIPLTLLDSFDARTWTRFWKDPPTVVGIDTEGNQISPPVLVQVAFGDTVILETPRPNGALSKDMERLLRDDGITKVFCDNFAHKDKRCLGIGTTTNQNEGSTDYTVPPIVDIEMLAMEPLGYVKSPRGLGRLVTLTMPEMNVRIEKPKDSKGTSKGRFANINRFARIEQGKAKPLRGLWDLSHKEQTYAALDAWCTLKVYQQLKKDDNNNVHLVGQKG
ncbi:3'-5' exonuclease [Nitzschia inconspicua]|uniref:3'-5' exonuclease n=1 Tax=Nitzschia inconspicua TaxID=303405 RepID=A0A9K3LP67_9STRA|nr:3'-5' exonuclease [Nitzschia inconspicua]